MLAARAAHRPRYVTVLTRSKDPAPRRAAQRAKEFDPETESDTVFLVAGMAERQTGRHADVAQW